MAKNNNTSSKYIYGNVAYDLEPSVSPGIEKNVKRNVRKNNSHKFKLMGKIVIIFMLSFLLVYRFTLVMKLTYDIRDTKTLISQLIDNNENIKIDLAEVNNIKNIENVAVDKEGMIVPDSNHIMYVSVKPLTLSSEKYSQSAFQMVQRLLGLIY